MAPAGPSVRIRGQGGISPQDGIHDGVWLILSRQQGALNLIYKQQTYILQGVFVHHPVIHRYRIESHGDFLPGAKLDGIRHQVGFVLQEQEIGAVPGQDALLQGQWRHGLNWHRQR